MRKLLLLAAILGLVAQSSFAFADDEDDEAFEGSVKASVASARQRNYVGGRDEQNIEIQSSLPQPTRSADGAAVPTSGGGESSHADD